MELVQTSEQNEFSLLNLNSTTEKINKTLSKIKEDFIYIGFLLWEVREYKFYLSKGYESVVDYAEKELNFKKTSTYNFISVCEKFSVKHDNGNPTIKLDSKYKDFNFSQLVEIKTLPVEQLESFNSSMSNRDIKEKKKELNIVAKKKDIPIENIIDVEFKIDQEKLAKNQISVDDFSIDHQENISEDFNIEIKALNYRYDKLVDRNLNLIDENKQLNIRLKKYDKAIVEKNELYAKLNDKYNALSNSNNETVILDVSDSGENESLKINYNVLLKETDILRTNFKILSDEHEKLVQENEKIKKENLKLKKSNLDLKQIDSEKSIISDILKVLNLEWSKVESDDYAEGLNKAIRLINQKIESNM